MNVEVQPSEDTKEYPCPANNSHKIYGEDNFLKHIMRCKDFEGKKFWCCKYYWTHMFHFREERDHHENVCEFIRPNVERYKDYFHLSKNKDSPERAYEKSQNIINSRYYYEKNKSKLEYEKIQKRKLREKREREAAAKMDEDRRLHMRLQENNKYYTKEYVLENAIFINADMGRFFMILAEHGSRKLEKRNFDMKVNIDLGDRLLEISQLEYKMILGGELIAHPDYVKFFDKLKIALDTETCISCWDFCDSNDELVALASSRHVRYLPGNRIALIVLKKSMFLTNQRPFHIQEKNVSSVFVNEYDQYLEDEIIVEDRNDENASTLATYEYKHQIDKKFKNIMQLIQDSLVSQNSSDPLKKASEELEGLRKDKEALKLNEKKLKEHETNINNELDGCKRELRQKFLNKIRARQEELNSQINRFNTLKLPELEELDQTTHKLEEEENDLLKRIHDNKIEMDGVHKTKKAKDGQIMKLEETITQKKKTIAITKSLALTNMLDSVCHVCQLNRINILYLPCCHFYVCEECQKKASEVGRHECLYCLKPLDKLIRVIV